MTYNRKTQSVYAPNTSMIEEELGVPLLVSAVEGFLCVVSGHTTVEC